MALHFRRAPQRAAECREVMREYAPARLLDVIAGSEVIEARPRGADKGVAPRSLANRKPFSGRLQVYVGDDQTDEDGIVAAQELGGFGVKIGSGESAARYRLPDVPAVHRWLRASLANLAVERSA